MKIICLGWGSLVWDPRTLRLASEWKNGGPLLPLEFKRASSDGRLTLVLVEGAEPIQALWAELNYSSPDEAMEALREREGCPSLKPIGGWPNRLPKYSVGIENIESWGKDVGADFVVWTALCPKFNGQNGHAPADAQEAISYLNGLGPGPKEKAKEYVQKAPAQIDTPFRVEFERVLGWEKLTAALSAS